MANDLFPAQAHAALALTHNYKKHPEFNGLEAYVWEYLNQMGMSIPEIEAQHGKEYAGEPNQQQSKDEPIWHSKPGLDDFVARSLNLKLSDYGMDKSRNDLYKAIANAISVLRRDKILIDWERIKSRKTGVGVWRLDKTRIGEYVLGHAKAGMKNRYYSAAMPHTILVRQRQDIFRSDLLEEYCRCVFCGFKLDQYLIGAHIVPYSIMRKAEPNNSMNPENGLLLCKMCDIAFEHGDIMVEKDLGIVVSACLKDQRDGPIKSWTSLIGTEICLGRNPRFPPRPRYLEWKKRLVRGI